MRLTPYCLILFCAFTGFALAVQSIDQPFAELKLTDGRVLKNAKLKSFNSTSVFVKDDDGIAQVHYELFPEELQPQLVKARAAAMPASTPATQTIPSSAQEYEAEQTRRAAQMETERQTAITAKDPSDSIDTVKQVEAKVTKHLRSYFMTRSAIGVSSNAQPESVDIDIDSTKPVEGWTQRYETTGTATITTASIYAPNYACHFEVTAEIDKNNVVQIIDTKAERIHE